MTSDRDTAGWWRRLARNSWTPSLVTLVIAIAFSLASTPSPPPRVGDTFRLGEFEYTVVSLSCRAIPPPNPEGDQRCLGKIAVANTSNEEGRQAVELLLVSMAADGYQPTERTELALDRNIEPGAAALVSIAFRPPAGLMFERLELALSTGDSASVQVLAGAGLVARA